jgi:competence protein CoiA
LATNWRKYCWQPLAAIGNRWQSIHLLLMRFALSNSQRIEATPAAVGFCPGCGAKMSARCGTKKIWHWAHKGRRHCDQWWENETEWHRAWKSQFSPEWQEIPARDEQGELHVADIKTPYGLTIEFQHSAIKLDEVVKRTAFYNHVIWIIDATRRPTDGTQYAQMLEYSYPERFSGVDIYTVHHEATRLLKEWGSLGRFIGFDYGGDNLCLLTAAQGHHRYLFDLPKSEFIRLITEGEPLPVVQFGKPVRQR